MNESEGINENRIREKLGKYINSIVAFSLIFFLIFIISGIWHSIYACSLDSEFFEMVAGNVPRNVAISIAVLSFGALFVVIVLLVFLYLIGSHFFIHLTILIVCIAAIIGNIVLTSINLAKTKPSEQKRFENYMNKLITENSTNPKVADWLKQFKCTNVENCKSHVDVYCSFRVKGERIACIISLLVTGCSIIGIVITTVLMGCMKRPSNMNEIEINKPDDNKTTV